MARVVGYFEYLRSLALLDQLVNSASTDELAAIDEIVKSRDEFALFTNLAQRVELRASTFTPPAAAVKGDERRGLGWVMALARVELGAMVAGFTDRDRPFTLVRPSRYEMPQYKEIMVDSLRTHYAALERDPAAQRYAWQRDRQVTKNDRILGNPKVNDQHAIAYARRAALVTEFARAVRELGAAEMSPPQVAQLQQWEGDLTGLQKTILLKVLGLGDSVGTGTNTTTQKTQYDDIYAICPRLRCLDSRGSGVQINNVSGQRTISGRTVNGRPAP